MGQWKRAQRAYDCWQNDAGDHKIGIGDRYYAAREHMSGEIMRYCESCFADTLGCTDAGEAERQRH